MFLDRKSRGFGDFHAKKGKPRGPKKYVVSHKRDWPISAYVWASLEHSHTQGFHILKEHVKLDIGFR